MAQLISATLYISPNTIPQNNIIITDPLGSSPYVTKSVSGNYIKCDITGDAGTYTISAAGYNIQQVALTNGDTKYITMMPVSYVSNLSDGTNTYVIMDEDAQRTSNLVTSVSASSTDSQYPSAKLFYDTIVDIETILHNINSGSIDESES